MTEQEKIISEKFNRSFTTYDQHASAQFCAGERLINLTCAVQRTYTHVLDAGCGTGLITNALAENIYYESFHAIDTAPLLLKRAALHHNTISFQHLNFNDIKPVNNYDLIFSNMALHWSRSFIHTLNIFREALTDDGVLAFTIPLHGTFAELSGHFSIQEFMSLNLAQSLLQSAGFQLKHSSQYDYIVAFPDPLSALRSIKLTGANYVKQPIVKSLRGKSVLSQHSPSELTYNIGFFIAYKSHD